MVITIDGPAGSGKSTATRNLARALNIAWLDTGATYRAVTLKALRNGADLNDGAALADVARTMDLKLLRDENSLRVILDGRDVTEEIRSEEVSANSRYVARAPRAREVLVELHRRLGSELGDFVAEGRDQGSVVFPDADVKFYLDAAPETRARRRHEEHRARGDSGDYDTTLRAIIERDRSDRSRAVGPLVRPDGAIVVDTSQRTCEQTLAELLRHVRTAG